MRELANALRSNRTRRLGMIPHRAERRVILLLGDLIAMAIVGGSLFWLLTSTASPLWLAFPVFGWFLFASLADCYDLHVSSKRIRIVPRVFLAGTLNLVLYLVVYFVFSREVAEPGVLNSSVNLPFDDVFLQEPGRLVPLLFIAGSVVFITGWRIVYTGIFENPQMRRRAVIIGAGLAGRALVRDTESAVNAYEFVGFIDNDPTLKGIYVAGLKVLGDESHLQGLVDSGDIDTVVLATPHESRNEILSQLIPLYEQGISVQSMERLYEDVVRTVPVEYVGPNWFLMAMNKSFPTIDYIFKRLIDVLFGLGGLAVFALLFPFVALAIYLDCPGPIFYRQERLGLRGKSFWLFKFRSMVPNAEAVGQATWAKKGDSRITRVGRFMRLTRIDELPQVLNILRGEMSVVGPRPERPQFVEQLEKEIPYYRTRLSVKPGLTGWAQVKYRYGASVEDSLTKLKYDLFYIKNQSIVLDLLIIFRTIGVVLFMKGT